MNSQTNFFGEHHLNNLHSIFNMLKGRANIDEQDIANLLPLAITGLTQFINVNPFLRKEAYEKLKKDVSEIKDFLRNCTLPDINERMVWANSIEENAKNVFGYGKETQQSNLKLIVNAPANVVYDLFRQLKNVCIDGSNPVLSQPYRAIAVFIKENIEGFDNISIESMEKQLTREQVISKSRLEVKIS